MKSSSTYRPIVSSIDKVLVLAAITNSEPRNSDAHFVLRCRRGASPISMKRKLTAAETWTCRPSLCSHEGAAAISMEVYMVSSVCLVFKAELQEGSPFTGLRVEMEGAAAWLMKVAAMEVEERKEFDGRPEL